MDDVRCIRCGAPADVSKNWATALAISPEGPAPVTPPYECDACGAVFSERHYRWAVESGELPPPP